MTRLFVILLMIASAAPAMGLPNTGDTDETLPAAGQVLPPAAGLRTAGDTFASAIPITSMPYADSVSTLGYNNDYDEACPYAGSTSPDVVYRYVPPDSVSAIRIDLCHSSYDTKVYVYQNALGNLVGCNDDYYAGWPCHPYASLLPYVPLSTGQTYYIVVDGYGGQGGMYRLNVSAVTLHPTPIPCPAGAYVEGEPRLEDGYTDNYNGGCNSTPHVYQLVEAQSSGHAVLWGKSGTFWRDGRNRRDTDWYSGVAAGGTVTITCTAAFPLQLILVSGLTCPIGDGVAGTAAPNTPLTLSLPFAANAPFWIWVGPQVFSGIPESDYVLEVGGMKSTTAPTGACCFLDPVNKSNDRCAIITQDVCQGTPPYGLAGWWNGANAPCAPNPCRLGYCCTEGRFGAWMEYLAEWYRRENCLHGWQDRSAIIFTPCVPTIVETSHLDIVGNLYATPPLPAYPFIHEISAGTQHFVAVNYDGTLVAEGSNASGQCNIPAPNSGFAMAAAGGDHSLGLKSDGTIVCWGGNSHGQCNVPLPNSGFVRIAAGSGFSLGLKSDGTIVAWGQNDLGQCHIPPAEPDSGFVAVSAGGAHALALTSTRGILAWGDNSYGQCNVPAPDDAYTAVAAGRHHSLGLKSDGTIVAWGDNSYGQCSVPAPNAGFVALAAGGRHSLGLKSDGTIVAWGDNTSGQCNVIPPPPSNPAVTSIAAGAAYSLFLSEWDVSGVESPSAGRVKGLQIVSVTPNPITNAAAITFDLETPGTVTLMVFDVGGRAVVSSSLGSFPAGRSRASWTAQDGVGGRAPSGVYFLRMQGHGANPPARRVLMIR